jgi:hypothetical protein
MTEILIVSGLVFLIAALAVVFERPRISRIVLAAPLFAGALIVWGLVFEAPNVVDGPYGATRLSLQALIFSPKVGGAISVGGDAQNDDVVLSPGPGAAAWRIGRGRLPAHFLDIQRVSQDAVELQLRPQSGVSSRVVVAIGAKPETMKYLGAVPAPTGAQPCASACAGAHPVLFEAKKASVYSVDVLDVVTPRQGVIRPTGGFLFTPSDNTGLLQAGVPGAVSRYRIAPGETAKVTLYEAVASPPRQTRALGDKDQGDTDPQAGPLIVHRSFEIAFDPKTGLSVIPDTPQGQVLDLEDAGAGRPAVRLGSGASAEESAGVGEAIAAFSLLGRSFDSDLSQIRLDVPRQSNQPTIVHESDGSQRAARGAVVLGAEHRVRVAVLPLDFLSGIYPFLWIAAVMALLGGVFASLRLRLDDPLAALVFGAVELLLSLRILIAVEGAFVDETSKAQMAVGGALVALPLGLLVVITAHPRSAQHRFGVACLAVLTLATAVLSWATTGQVVDVVYLAVLGAVGCVVHVYAPGLLPRVIGALRGVLSKLSGWIAAKLGPRPDAWWASLVTKLKSPATAPLLVGVGGGLILVGLRGLFLLAGDKEGLKIGSLRVALSLLFTPLTLAFAAPLIAFARNGWAGGWPARRAAIGYLFLLGVGVGGASFLVKDNGFMIIGLAIITAALTAYLGREEIAGWPSDLVAAVVPAGLALVWLMLWATGLLNDLGLLIAMGVTVVAAAVVWIGRPGGAWLAPALGAAGLLAVINIVAAVAPLTTHAIDLDQALRADTNRLRLFAALAPPRLLEAGTRGADALHDTVEHMREYGKTFWGRGYFTLPPPTVLKPYHLTDNLSAVHLISPFGRAGAFALMLAPIAVAIAACVCALRVPGPARSWPWLGALAALTFAMVSTYMVLANLLAAPFTGRNVYLLAATSSSDLVEGLMLMALVLIALGARREDVAP